MAPRDKKILKLLEMIEKGSVRNQRQMAAQLDLSLGLVNKLIQDLISQDLLKTNDPARNKAYYQLTPKGIAEKIALQKQHLCHNIDCYAEIKRMVNQKLRQLHTMSKTGILFYGAGELCEIACMVLAKRNSPKIMIIDDEKQGKTFNGYSIYKEKEIKGMAYDGIVIMDIDNTNEIRKRLMDNGIPLKKIYTLFP